MSKKAKSTPSSGPSPASSTGTLQSNPEEVNEKELVEEYLAQHGLENTLNLLVNQVVRDRPADPYLVLGDLLQSRATSGKGIFSISAREIVDSNGLPTLLASVHTPKGRFEGSTSSFTSAIFDTDDVTRFRGMGIRARDLSLYVQHLLEGMDPSEQAACDEKILSMEDKLGRQACLALSIAICKAGAVHKDVPLFEHIAALADVPIENACIPVPIFSIIHGSNFGSSKVFLQDITAMPLDCASFQDALRWGAEFQLVLKELLVAKGLGHSNRGVFGGFVPLVSSSDEALLLVRDALAKLKEIHPTAVPIAIGIDVAAHAFASAQPNGDCVYNLDKWIPGSKGLLKSGDELMEIIKEWWRQHHITTVVDPFDVRDVKLASTLLRNVEDEATSSPQGEGNVGIGGDASVKLQVVGHDLLQLGFDVVQEERACNTVLIHLSNFSTVTQAIKSVNQARVLGLALMMGCDPGTTDDVFPVDFAIGVGCGQVKMGGLGTADAIARYNRFASFVEDPRSPQYAGAIFRR
ncbi:hypothetical protein AC1031_013240 [Aphanomyces cochlioides]|nr:hypothetical protein AC1031_013240 [Aphanomyces cochlioides]